MKERTFANSEYRYGFNGQEQSDELDQNGNSYTAEFWQYDARIGRRWNIDPVVVESESGYATFKDNPIALNDPNGNCSGPNCKEGNNPYAPSFQHRLNGNNINVESESIAQISIINYDGSTDVSNSIKYLNTFFETWDIPARAVEYTKEEGKKLGNQCSSGKNAIYLMASGIKNTREELMSYTTKYIDSRLNGYATFNSSDRGALENATGWNFYYSKKAGFSFNRENYDGNAALIATDKYYHPYTYSKGGTDEKSYSGPNIKPHESMALTVLHVMGHNAGISNGHNPTDLHGIMDSGYLLYQRMNNGTSFDQFTSMDEISNIIWLNIVQNYFGKEQGNPRFILGGLDFSTWNSTYKRFEDSILDFFRQYTGLQIPSDE